MEYLEEDNIANIKSMEKDNEINIDQLTELCTEYDKEEEKRIENKQEDDDEKEEANNIFHLVKNSIKLRSNSIQMKKKFRKKKEFKQQEQEEQQEQEQQSVAEDLEEQTLEILSSMSLIEFAEHYNYSL
eukprot:CAMPEP_0116892364 /NCGR_PEP_ID=MMETSP0467-20121206/2610_1 /TAXON_ID=283647 /ORGANISM="Mesodinium pulex, Strain SPMC105" /LENGTH=128 /DNA_ID=CAMNT_0004561465 /DNA_START=2105 /DNA_END=2491 /DNA_ORIENTATION=-